LDLDAEPVIITLPNAGKRFMSMQGPEHASGDLRPGQPHLAIVQAMRPVGSGQ
jgi:hypothetical protein